MDLLLCQYSDNISDNITAVLGMIDIVSDFIFYYSIKDDVDVDEVLKVMVLCFAIMGAVSDILCYLWKHINNRFADKLNENYLECHDDVYHHNKYERTIKKIEYYGTIYLIRSTPGEYCMSPKHTLKYQESNYISHMDHWGFITKNIKRPIFPIADEGIDEKIKFICFCNSNIFCF